MWHFPPSLWLTNYLGPPITLTQLKAANIGMKRGISPGWDGVPPKFCTTFRNLRGQFILNMIKCPVEKGWFLKWYLALLSVLPKPSKDHILCSNYRPLSILTTVKAFACILKLPFLSLIWLNWFTVVHISSQTDFILRLLLKTSDNVPQLLNIINTSKDIKSLIAVFSLDAK